MAKAQDLPTTEDRWYESELYRDWYNAVVREPANDFLIVVTASSKTPVSGSGKTSIGVNLAEKTDLTGEGFDAEGAASLDAEEIAYNMVPDIPDRSAVIWDEAQGTVGTTGLDSRRAMRDANVDAINSILANRDKRLTIIIIAQQFSTLDPRLYPITDAWLLITHEPSHPKGPAGKYHRVFYPDYKLHRGGEPHTPIVERFEWRKVPHSNSNYQILERKKQDSKRKNTSDEDEQQSLPKAEQLRLAESYHDTGIPWRKVGEMSELLEYSGEYYRQLSKDQEEQENPG